MQLNIRNKIILISVTIFCLIIGANTWVNGVYFTTEYSKARQSEVFIIIQNLKTQLDRLLTMHIPIRQIEGFDEICEETIAKHPFLSFAMVASPDGEILFHSDRVYTHQAITEPSVLAACRSSQRQVLTTHVNGEDIYDFFIPVMEGGNHHIATIRAGFPLEIISHKTRAMAAYSVSITLMSLILGVILLVMVLNLWVTGPINLFIRAIENIGKNWADPGQQVKITTRDEIGQLATAFNSMTCDLRRTTVSKNYMDSIIENMLNTILVIAPDNRIRSVNRATLDLLGYEKEDLIGSPVTQVLENPQDLLQGENGNSEAVYTPAEAVYRSKNGRAIPVLFSTGMMRDDNGQVTGFVCVAQDITRLKRAEKEKISAENMAHENKKLALIGQVAGKMAHDFNNILSAIMGVAELERMESTDKNTIKSLDLIIHQTLRGKNLTKNLVLFAKSHELKQEFFNVNDKVDLTLSLMKNELKNITVGFIPGEGLPELLADPGMIEHCMINILQNAAHALSKTQNPCIDIKTYRRNHHIYIDVTDNGCGIPAEYLNCVFDPSFTLKGSKDATRSYATGIKGTGYGMANVKKYMDQHRGDVRIDSGVESGTTVTLIFPVIDKELSKKEKTTLGTRKILSGKRILIVEDEPAISYVQNRILSQPPCSHQVDVARTAHAAMEFLDATRYDLISLDYVLPGRLTGMDIYAHIRKTNQTVPILFASGNMEFLEAIAELKKKDARLDHVTKPCQNLDYITSINALMIRTEGSEPAGLTNPVSSP